MKELPIRRFTTVVDYLVEETIITKGGVAIGTYRPWSPPVEVAGGVAVMDDTARKAIEPDKTKVERGQIRKGLGDLPGEERKEVQWRPVPKPGKPK